MRSMALLLAAAAVTTGLNGCSGGWWPFRSSAEQGVRLPADAVEYNCAQGKRLVVRHPVDGKSVWVMYPDREFRLDRVGAAEQYSNGATTLIAGEGNVTLSAEGSTQFADCKRTKR